MWVNLSTNDQRLWGRFCEAIGRPDLADDERFATPVDRFRNGPEVVAILDEVLGSEPFAHWAPRLDASGVVWGRVAELPELVDDPQARATGMFAEVVDPDAGPFEMLNAPFTLSASEVAVRGPAPRIGQHTEAVLTQLGIDRERIAALGAAGVVGGVAPG